MITPTTLASYEIFIYSLRETAPAIFSSTLRIIRSGPAAGQVVGTLTFRGRVPRFAGVICTDQRTDTPIQACAFGLELEILGL
jgi:hypothetical protein